MRRVEVGARRCRKDLHAVVARGQKQRGETIDGHVRDTVGDPSGIAASRVHRAYAAWIQGVRCDGPDENDNVENGHRACHTCLSPFQLPRRLGSF